MNRFRAPTERRHMLVGEISGLLAIGTQNEMLALGKTHDIDENLYIAFVLTTNDPAQQRKATR